MEDDDAAKLFATDEIIIFVWPPLFRQTSDPPLFIQIRLKFASKDLTREKRKNHRFHEYKLVFWKWIFRFEKPDLENITQPEEKKFKATFEMSSCIPLTTLLKAFHRSVC